MGGRKGTPTICYNRPEPILQSCIPLTIQSGSKLSISSDKTIRFEHTGYVHIYLNIHVSDLKLGIISATTYIEIIPTIIIDTIRYTSLHRHCCDHLWKNNLSIQCEYLVPVIRNDKLLLEWVFRSNESLLEFTWGSLVNNTTYVDGMRLDLYYI